MYLFTSSLTFGILLLFRASLAQSAPFIYQDSNEDEEALLDRLASLTASISGSQQYSRPQQQLIYPNYDTAKQLQDSLNDDLEFLAKLPTQFGYRPNDVRFYLPAEQFPPNLSRNDNDDESDKADSDTPKYRTPKQNLGGNGRLVETQQQNNVEVEVPTHNEHVEQMLSEGGPSHFMKKNEIKETGGLDQHHEQNIIAGPSNIMSSDHSAETPYHTLYTAENESFGYSDIYYIGLIAGCSAAVVIGVVAVGIFWIHQRVKAAAEVDYHPAYGVTGPSKDVSPTSGDRKLAASAQIYHYQHQKQQLVTLQKGAADNNRPGSAGSDVESEDDNEDDNDYTVYECPGLAPAGEMEVKNPLFCNQDEATPASPSLKSED